MTAPTPRPSAEGAARPGDIFCDKDPRSDGRHLKVVTVEGRYARLIHCTVAGLELPGRRTRVSLRGLETRFERVGGSRLRADLERAVIEAVKEWRAAEAATLLFIAEAREGGRGLTLNEAERYYALKDEEKAALAALRASADELLKGEG